MKKTKTVRMLLASVAFTCFLNAEAQWGTIPSPNTVVAGTTLGATAQGGCDISAVNNTSQMYAVTWHDGRSGSTNYNIYAQCFDNAGNAQWGTNGMLICNATGNQLAPRITSDNSGAFYIAWEDSRNGNSDIYMQRVNSNGTIAWTSNGIKVAGACGTQSDIEIINLPVNNGVAVSWVDGRNGDKDIYAQWFNTTGTAQWKANGIIVSAAAYDQYRQKIAENTAGQIIVVWEDMNASDIYGQRLDATTGLPQWSPKTGKVMCSFSSGKSWPQLVTSGTNFFISWIDNRSSLQNPYYAMLNNSGTVTSSPSTGTQAFSGSTNSAANSINMISDRAAGVFIAWDDYRNGTDYDIYAQRVLNTGAISAFWPAAGSQIVIDNPGNYYKQSNPQMATCDDQLIVSFVNLRTSPSVFDIYYQDVVTANGNINPFFLDGRTLCTAVDKQWRQRVTVMGSQVVAVWEDSRNSVSNSVDLFCSEIPITCTNNPVTTSLIVPMTKKSTLIEAFVDSKYAFYEDYTLRQIKITHPTETYIGKVSIVSLDGIVIKEILDFKIGDIIDLSAFAKGVYTIHFSGTNSTVRLSIP